VNPGQRWKPLAGLIVALLGAVFMGLVCLGAILTAVHPTAKDGSRAGDIVLAVVAVALLALGVYVAIHAEHLLRHVSAPTDDPNRIGPPPPLWSIRRGTRRHGPVATGFSALMTLAVTGIMFAIAVSAHSAAVQSHRTQSKGRAVSALVEHVQHVVHHGRYSTWYTARVTVMEPTGATTVAHVPHDTNLAAGTPVEVLVDPSDAGYAEFPSQPAATTTGWVISLIFAFGLLAFGLNAWRHLFRLRRGSIPTRWSPQPM